jgi:citrate lyase subunit beta/citryl-CoA lyase
MGVERSPRSLLYVPGDRPHWVPKAWASDADAVILDLEDSVAPARRALAREDTARVVAENIVDGVTAGEIWVRVDASTLAEDLTAVVGPGLRGVMLAKAEPSSLRMAASLLDRLEAERSLPPQSLSLIALVETAQGIRHLWDVAESPRVSRMALGEADLAGELGLMPDQRRTELLPLRLAVVVASASAGLERPIGPVHTALDDAPGLASSSAEQLRQGFRARTAIHPNQIQTINLTFTPDAEEVDRARTIVSTYEEALASGAGAVRGPDGQIMDRATVRIAREILARARAG